MVSKLTHAIFIATLKSVLSEYDSESDVGIVVKHCQKFRDDYKFKDDTISDDLMFEYLADVEPFKTCFTTHKAKIITDADTINTLTEKLALLSKQHSALIIALQWLRREYTNEPVISEEFRSTRLIDDVVDGTVKVSRFVEDIDTIITDAVKPTKPLVEVQDGTS